MNSAIKPPMKKNTKHATMYMMPINLWSVVVISL